jgi:hypothetical protein
MKKQFGMIEHAGIRSAFIDAIIYLPFTEKFALEKTLVAQISLQGIAVMH